MPIFRFGNLPITDIVVVEGREWAQPILFTGLSWSDINDVCSGGPCTVGGKLNSYDMTDWRWASVNDVNSLFNNIFGAPVLGLGPGLYGRPASGTFAFDTFRNDDGSGPWQAYAYGYPVKALSSSMADAPPLSCSGIGTDGTSDFAATGDDAFGCTTGGWFYRTPSP